MCQKTEGLCWDGQHKQLRNLRKLQKQKYYPHPEVASKVCGRKGRWEGEEITCHLNVKKILKSLFSFFQELWKQFVLLPNYAHSVTDTDFEK